MYPIFSIRVLSIKILMPLAFMLALVACNVEQAGVASDQALSNPAPNDQALSNQAASDVSASHQRSGIDPNSALYEVQVQQGISHEDVVDSLKSISEGMNFVNPANFPIGENMKKRDIDPQGVKEVYTYCNLSLGTEIVLDHPEFLVFAPCRIALYEKPDANNNMRLYLGLDRPTYDLKSIKNPTKRAQKAAQALEDAMIELMQRASEGDF